MRVVSRGKGAFLSGCVTLSDESYLGGCWTQDDDFGERIEETDGCQTCTIQEDAFSEAVFPIMFPAELDPCPDDLDYTALYEGTYGGLSLVTAASLSSTGCPEGWLYFEDTGNCYFKSPNTAKAENQADAVSICEEEGAWVIAIDSEAENDFLLHNMLFTGFFGETYTGMTKESPSDEWEWPAESSDTAYNCVGDYSDWLEGAEIGCAAVFDGGEDGSCMEIFPYEPKGWNPFSCDVGKHYVCEMPATAGGEETGTASPGGCYNNPRPPPPTAKRDLFGGDAGAYSCGIDSATVGCSCDCCDKRASAEHDFFPERGAYRVEYDRSDAFTRSGDDNVDSQPAPTPSPQGVEETPGPTVVPSWAGANSFYLALRGVWTDASYSLYLEEGDVETAVVTGATKEALGTVTHTFAAKDGCYRLEVYSSGNPTLPEWHVVGGDAYGGTGDTSGAGLDGVTFTAGGGVCGVSECQALCLSDLFGGSDGGQEASSTCDGYAALISGACGDVCPEDEEEGLGEFQQGCVRAGCAPEALCDLDIEGGGDGLDVEYHVEVRALLEAPVTTLTSSAAGVGNPEEEFELAVALWLGVDQGDVAVRVKDGFEMEEGEEVVVEEEEEVASRRRGLQTVNSETPTTYTRYSARVQPANLTATEATELVEIAAAGADGSDNDLQSWLWESGGSWTEVSVPTLEVEVVEELNVLTSDSSGDASDASEGAEEGGDLDDPLIIGGIAAGAVVVVGLVMLALCCSRKANKKSDTRARARTRNNNSSSGSSSAAATPRVRRNWFCGTQTTTTRIFLSTAVDPSVAAWGWGRGRGLRWRALLQRVALPRRARSSAAAAAAARSGSGGSGPVGSQRSNSASPPVATVDTASLSAQDSSAGGSVTTGAAAGGGALGGPSGGPGQHHGRRSSSTFSFAANNSSLAVRDAENLETKRPSVRGPSGALASLGFARGCSLDVFEEENTAGGNPSERVEDGGSMYDGGSEAGSRYTPSRPAASGSAVGSARQAEVFGSQYSTAGARIQELRDRQRVKATPVTFQAPMSMPSPGGPVTPGNYG
ncbi:conserved unknown protein [Ectocarpus siliculosus]|uniref:C-type lectin domain-containing protein n=1 Tax=Ectocarpus siliculosus TaxID=2880 RepID=D8LHR0_ECTSI|nr:conserved unknown protein [Ectocarpus siliculosus]|eukprot:CBN79342.1 conserved unknown protein [Ectocarpus siliculosus]